MVSDEDDIDLYINGVNRGGESNNSSVNQPINIGRRFGTTYEFNGVVDEVRIYNRAITQTEITTLYEENIVNYVNVEATELTNESSYFGLLTNVVGYWKFDSDTKDSSGYGNHSLVAANFQNPGKVGTARIFNGTSDFAGIVEASSGTVQVWHWTSTSWVKINASWRRMFGK